jgi:hypothetical protein
MSNAPAIVLRNGDDVLRLLREHFRVLRERFSVSRIGLFGSWARNAAHERSDIDLLVSFDIPTFDHYMDLKLYLEDLTAHTVDVVMETALRPRLREHILKEVRYAA